MNLKSDSALNYLVDPDNITKYNSSAAELELAMLFWICAAGKKAKAAANNLYRLLEDGRERFGVDSPFEIIRRYGPCLAEELRLHGIGCYRNKAGFMLDLVSKGLDLERCTVEDLESVRGIGPKTARCFLMHTRRGVRHAGLDTHVLKYMGEMGFVVPKSTPSGSKYLKLEREFLGLVDSSGKTVAEFDLEIWRHYSSGGRFPLPELSRTPRHAK